MSGNSNGKISGAVVWVVAFLQPFVIAGLLYWAGRVDGNTATITQQSTEIGRIQGQLEQMSKQLDRIEANQEAR